MRFWSSLVVLLCLAGTAFAQVSDGYPDQGRSPSDPIGVSASDFKFVDAGNRTARLQRTVIVLGMWYRQDGVTFRVVSEEQGRGVEIINYESFPPAGASKVCDRTGLPWLWTPVDGNVTYVNSPWDKPTVVRQEYTQAKADENALPVLVEVWTASWCTACPQMEPTIAKLRSEGQPVREIVADSSAETEQAARDRAVNSFPTIIVYVGQQRQAVLTGVQSYEQMTGLLQRAWAARRQALAARTTARRP